VYPIYEVNQKSMSYLIVDSKQFIPRNILALLHCSADTESRIPMQANKNTQAFSLAYKRYPINILDKNRECG